MVMLGLPNSWHLFLSQLRSPPPSLLPPLSFISTSRFPNDTDLFSVGCLTHTASGADFSPIAAADGAGSLLQLFERLGIDEEEEEALVKKHPQLRTTPVDFMRQRIASLRSVCIADDIQLHRIIVKTPRLLTAEEFGPFLDYIHDELPELMQPAKLQHFLAGTNTETLPSFPQRVRLLLSHGVPVENLGRFLNSLNLKKVFSDKTVEEIEATIVYLKKLDGFSWLLKRPQLLNLDLQRQLVPRIEYLTELNGGDEKSTAALISKLPYILAYTVKHYKGHLEVWNTVGLEDEDFFKVALVYPNIFSISRDRKLVPRMEFLQQCGLDSKYNVINFFPKSLYEQFRRVANCYFLFSGILSFTPLSPYGALSAVLPLLFVIVVSMVKEAIEDWKRLQMDNEGNNRKVQLHQGDGTFKETEWKNLKVGDVVKVEKDNFFPADLLLISSSYEDAVCYVETMNLDGETNLKLKQALDVTSTLQDDSSFRDFNGMVKCEDPNANLYSFVGTMDYQDTQYPLTPQQLLLRDSKLRNTDHIYGTVIFTGHDTKVMQNATTPPSKRSTIEKLMDKLVYSLLGSLVVISLIGSIVFGIDTSNDLVDGVIKRWYLRPDDSDIYFDPNNPEYAGFLHFLTAMILYGYFIPISLYVSIEIVKVMQSIFINQDIRMYYEPADKPAHARTSNLNEELGQVHTILTDKTGTLTCNSMEFIKCSIAGMAYGRGITEVERAMARKKGSVIEEDDDDDEHLAPAPAVKGFNFKDERIMDNNWLHQPHSGTIQMFFRLLAICHTAIPEVDENSRKISYEAESPDEAAFVIAAREVGFEFYQRTQTTISLHEFSPSTGMIIEKDYQLLNIIEFNSTRKRMSVIVRTEKGKLLLLCKGADNIMFELLGKNGRRFEADTTDHINKYADAGLRTLVLAYRELDEEEYDVFNKKYTEAKLSVSADREDKIAAAAELVEKDFMLLGATAVEDKLQSGVPECIDKLAQAGIKIWVLTGDKMETAINIGFACSLLRQGMKQIVVTLDSPEIKALEKEGSKEVMKEAMAKASKASIIQQVNEGKKLIDASPNNAFALIIDGNSLTYALGDDVKELFLALATGCASVICCRSSPKQKALVTRLVKEGTGKTTLGIGDGANDVGMLQEADVGIGISGFEGMQAVMASDIAIAQFRYLDRLLLVHGHWCYRRITSMICYFFYKNIAFGITLYLFEAYTTFSGEALYNEWFLSFFNVFFTSLPVLVLGIFDQDVSAKSCLKFPLLYKEGIENVLFSYKRIFGWIFTAILNAFTIFYFCTAAIQDQAFRKGGQTLSQDILGLVMYTTLVWVVNVQMAIFVKYFTLLQHVTIWGSIAVWYLFMLAYGAITPSISTNAYMVFIEAAGPSAMYWFLTLFVVIGSVLPYFAYSAFMVRFFPMFHEMIQWQKKVDGQSDDPEFVEMVRARSIRSNTVGFSARRESLLS